MLSFTKGKPIAVVCGGPLNDKVVHIMEESDEPDRSADSEDIYDILSEEEFKLTPNQFKLLSVRDRNKLKQAMATHQEPLDDYLIEPYRQGAAKLKDALKKELTLTGGTMVIMPDKKSERVMIAGMSGAGKSCLAAMYMHEYHQLFPKRKIVLISSHDGEKAYEKIKHVVIPLTDFQPDPETKTYEPLAVADLKECLVVFDDCDNIADKTIDKHVQALNNDLIANGRKYDIHVMTLSHHLMNYSKTRNLLLEANKVVFFSSGTAYHVNQFLQKYGGLDKECIKKIMGLKSRWCMLAQAVPAYVVHEHGAFLLR